MDTQPITQEEMDTQPITQEEMDRAKEVIAFGEIAMHNPDIALARMSQFDRSFKQPCCQTQSEAWFYSTYHYIGRTHTAYRFGLPPHRLDIIEKVLKVMQALEG